MSGMTIEKGTSLFGMVKAAQEMGLQAEAVKTNIKTLKKDSRIVVLLLSFTDFNHYVILDKMENRKVRLLDGGKFRNLTIGELESIWKGYAIFIGKGKNRQ